MLLGHEPAVPARVFECIDVRHHDGNAARDVLLKIALRILSVTLRCEARRRRASKGDGPGVHPSRLAFGEHLRMTAIAHRLLQRLHVRQQLRHRRQAAWRHHVTHPALALCHAPHNGFIDAAVERDVGGRLFGLFEQPPRMRLQFGRQARAPRRRPAGNRPAFAFGCKRRCSLCSPPPSGKGLGVGSDFKQAQ